MVNTKNVKAVLVRAGVSGGRLREVPAIGLVEVHSALGRVLDQAETALTQAGLFVDCREVLAEDLEYIDHYYLVVMSRADGEQALRDAQDQAQECAAELANERYFEERNWWDNRPEACY